MPRKKRISRLKFLNKKREHFNNRTIFPTELDALNTLQKKIQSIIIDIKKSTSEAELAENEKKIDIYRRIHEELIAKQIVSNYPQTLEEQKKTGVIFYPELLDWTHFNAIISRKKEFKDYEYPPQYKTIDEYYVKADEACDTREKSRVLNYHQNFVRNFISPLTPYNGILLWHGVGTGKTCAGISIAEQFIHILGPNKKKCIVISSGTIIEDRWRNEIFNPDKDTNREDKSIQLQCTGDTYTSEYREYMSKKKDNKRIRKRKRNDLINRNYEFYGYVAFAGMLKILEKQAVELIPKSTRRNTITEESAKIRTIKRIFSNRVIIVDEAHNSNPTTFDKWSVSNSSEEGNPKTIRSKIVTVEGRKEKTFPPALKKVLRYAENVKLILLTATPMNNSASEIIWLLNLLLLNDKRGTIFLEEFFNNPGKREASLIEDAQVRKSFKQLCTGYISYLRGNNPISFPIQLTPDINNIHNGISHCKVITQADKTKRFIQMYIPSPKYEINNTPFIKKDDNVHPKVVYNPMSFWQYKYYKKTRDKEDLEEDEKRRNSDGFGIVSRQASVIIFPTNTPDPKMEDMFIGIPGGRGFNKAFKKISHEWKYRKHCVGFLKADRVRDYSIKFYNILKQITRSSGIVFVYSEWIEAGSIPFALMLEQNGYTRFTDPNYASAPLLHKRELRGDNMPIPRCWCGILHPEHDDEEIGHDFSQGTYVHFTGSDSKAELDFIIKQLNNHKNNINGERIKIIIATSIAKEGLSFFGVREIHIMSPWHHQNREKQVIGRGTRQCSHWQLERGERNITIYKHCATVPFISKPIKPEYKYDYSDPRDKDKWKRSPSKINNLLKIGIIKTDRSVAHERRVKEIIKVIMHETIDEAIYRKSRSKAFYIAKVERFLKKNAIDCLLNKAVNTHTSSPENEVIIYSSQKQKIQFRLGDQDGSEECDYSECNYTCEPREELEKELEVDTSTYQIAFSQNVIDIVKQYIRYLYILDYDYVLKDIKEYIRENPRYFQSQFADKITIFDNTKIEDEHIYLALHSMLTKKDILYDRFDRSGYLIYRNFSLEKGEPDNEELSHYIFQPMEIDNEAIPMRYRRKPLRPKPEPAELTPEMLEENASADIEDLEREDSVQQEEDSVVVSEVSEDGIDTEQILEELSQELLCWFPLDNVFKNGKNKRLIHDVSKIIPWLSFPKKAKSNLKLINTLDQIWKLAYQVVYEMLLSRLSHNQHLLLLEELYPKPKDNVLRKIYMKMLDSPNDGDSPEIKQIIREWDLEPDDDVSRESTIMKAYRYATQQGKQKPVSKYYNYNQDKTPSFSSATTLQKREFITMGIDDIPLFHNDQIQDVLGFMKTKKHEKPEFLLINYWYQHKQKRKKLSDKRSKRTGSECQRALGARTYPELLNLIELLVQPKKKTPVSELEKFIRKEKIPKGTDLVDIKLEAYIHTEGFNIKEHFKQSLLLDSEVCNMDRVYWKKQSKKKKTSRGTVKDLCMIIEFLLRFKRKLNSDELWYMSEFEHLHYLRLDKEGKLAS